MFFTKEQRELLEEISELENNPIDELRKDLKHSEMPERVFVDERKKLTVTARIKIAENIQSKYSMLNKPKGIFNEQLFSAMEEYLKQCEETGYRYDYGSITGNVNYCACICGDCKDQ